MHVYNPDNELSASNCNQRHLCEPWTTLKGTSGISSPFFVLDPNPAMLLVSFCPVKLVLVDIHEESKSSASIQCCKKGTDEER